MDSNPLSETNSGPTTDLEVVQAGRPWCFDGDGTFSDIVSEAHL